MIVWIVEHRTLRSFPCHPADVEETTVNGVFSTETLAIDFARRNLDVLAGDHSWFTISGDEVDLDVFRDGGENPVLIHIDRLGHLSREHQPASPPHLLTEWEDQ